MASFNISNSTILPNLKQTVEIDGKTRSDAFCTDISLGVGASGSTASLMFPALLWDEKQNLKGKNVVVSVGYTGQSEEVVFSGYINNINSDTGNNYVLCQCISTLGLANNVYIGQHRVTETGCEVSYPVKVNDTLTGWSVKSILRDIFSSNASTWKGGGGGIPTDWRSKLDLGSLTVLNDYYNQVNCGDISFNKTTLGDALQQLCDLVGTITFRERFTATKTYLDFFEIADPKAPTKEVRVARNGESIDGKNVLSISQDEGAEDVKTRLIAVGDNRKFIISLQGSDLEKDWLSSLESSVLNNPDSTKRSESKGDARGDFSEERAKVFRSYKIPDAIKNLVIDKDIFGSAIQVYKFGTSPVATQAGGWTFTQDSEPTLLEGTSFDLADNGTFTLKEPAIKVTQRTIDSSGNFIDTLEEATVGITLCVNHGRLFYDTGIKDNGMEFDGIDTSGLCEVVSNDSFKYVQITNESYSIDGETYGTWLFDGSSWTQYTSKSLLVDDHLTLQQFANLALREKNSVKYTYSITTPYWTSGFQLGDKIKITGQSDAVKTHHQIMSISYNLTNDHSASISTDSSLPMVASNILGG